MKRLVWFWNPLLLITVLISTDVSYRDAPSTQSLPTNNLNVPNFVNTFGALRLAHRTN
jgi:hypothetical protein